MGDVVNILAIETATPYCALGIATNGHYLSRVLDDSRRHTEVLAPGIEAMLAECALAARDLERVVVDVGPGLFTGLRVGIASAIGLAEGLGCPLVTVSSLELLAHGAHRAHVHGTLLCCVDGRRGEVFVQRFTLDDDVTPIDAPEVLAPRSVVIEWATSGAPVTFSGDGVTRYFRDFNAVPNGEVFEQNVPPVDEALRLAETREPSSHVVPLYLREADAVANFDTRTRQ